MKSIRLFTILSFLLLFSLQSFTFNSMEQALDEDDAFHIFLEQNKDLISIDFKIAHGYYMYKDSLSVLDSNKQKVNFTIVGNGVLKNDATFGKVIVYYNDLTLKLENKINNELTITYQGCWEVNYLCYPPITKNIILEPNSVLGYKIVNKNNIESNYYSKPKSTNSLQADGLAIQSRGYINFARERGLNNSKTEIKINSEQFKDRAKKDYYKLYFPELLQDKKSVKHNNQKEQHPVYNQFNYGNPNSLVNFITNNSYVLSILIFLLLGLLLSFSPCMLTVYPIIASIIFKQQTKKNYIKNLVAYVLGVAISYASIGAISGLVGSNIQLVLQSGWLKIIVSLIMLYLAGASFGFYLLQLPAFLRSKVAKISDSSSLFNLGLLSILLMGACVTPPFVAILTWLTQTGNFIKGFIILFVMAIGMNLPLILLVVLGKKIILKPAIARFIGVFWGFALIAFAIYNLIGVFSDYLLALLIINYFLFSAVSIFLYAKNLINWLKALLISFAIVLLVYSLSLIFVLLAGYKINFINPLKEISKRGTKLANSTKQLQLKIDTISITQLDSVLNNFDDKQKVAYFTADWCIECKILKQSGIFESEEFIFNANKVDYLEVDITNITTKQKAILKKYKVFGPPTFLFFDKNGNSLANLNIIGRVNASNNLINNLRILNNN